MSGKLPFCSRPLSEGRVSTLKLSFSEKAFVNKLETLDAEKYISKESSSIPGNPYLAEKSRYDVWRTSEDPVVCFSLKCKRSITGHRKL